MSSSFAVLVEAILGLVIMLVALNALLTCARELGAIRKRLDRLAPEAMTSLKSARREKVEGLGLGR